MSVTRAILGALLGRRLPYTSGNLEAPGISGPVVIRRDRSGIPYVQAESEQDGFYALGFCQGQDRSFQIERLTRITRGTLSEIFGPVTLPIDRLTARVGLYRHAAEQLALLEEHDQNLLEAFAAGINAGVQVGCRKYAPEFALLGSTPGQISGADPLAILNFVALILSPWPYKINRLMVLRECGPDALQNLDGGYAGWIPATVPVGVPSQASPGKISSALQHLAGALGLGPAGGSNSWAVNASRTRTGRPLLANDPHLSPTIPPHWYLVCLETPEYKIRGALLAGTPFFSLGHNRHAAWGVTGGSADNADLFLEELDDEGLRFREGEDYRALQVTPLTIRVKGGEDFQDEIRRTPRGPIVSDTFEDLDLTLSLRTPWMDPRPLKNLFATNRVENFQDFRESWSRWYQASLNMVYADRDDTIGWQFIGDIPLRKVPAVIPAPGWNQAFSWRANRIPLQELPRSENPAPGMIATANNKPSAGEDPYLGFDFADGYRLARILEVLGERQDWDLAGMAALQEDTLALPWREIREIVLAAVSDSEDIQKALALLENWDGEVDADSPAAALYEFFLAELVQDLAETLAPNCQEWALGKAVHPLLYASLGKRQVSLLSQLLQDNQGIFASSREEAIQRSLMRAYRKLRKEYGLRKKNWAWGRIRPLTLEHPFGSQPLVGKVFQRGPFPWGGDSQTVSQAQRSLKIPAYNPTGIANLRMVLDVGEWERNQFVLAGGQSGNPFSPHYDDQLSLWRRGEALTLAWKEEDIQAAAVNTLRLIPEAKSGA